jgi:hypothetical protein
MTTTPNARWWPGEGIRVNPGRGATRAGNDAIPIWVNVPRWLADRMRQAFDTAGIAFAVREAYIRTELGDDHCLDRFAFPESAGDEVRGTARARAASAIQRVVDSVPGCRPPDR